VWYEQRDGLGIEFLQAIDNGLELIARLLEAGAPWFLVFRLTYIPHSLLCTSRTCAQIPVPHDLP